MYWNWNVRAKLPSSSVRRGTRGRMDKTEVEQQRQNSVAPPQHLKYFVAGRNMRARVCARECRQTCPRYFPLNFAFRTKFFARRHPNPLLRHDRTYSQNLTCQSPLNLAVKSIVSLVRTFHSLSKKLLTRKPHQGWLTAEKTTNSQ